jgi:hypothetical protein
MASSLQLATSQATPATQQPITNTTSTTTATVDYRSDMKRIIAASSTKDPSTADDTDVSYCCTLKSTVPYVLAITVPNPEIYQYRMAMRVGVRRC